MMPDKFRFYVYINFIFLVYKNKIMYIILRVTRLMYTYNHQVLILYTLKGGFLNETNLLYAKFQR